MERAKSETATADRARDAGVQKIILFQQNGRAQPKITGMNKYGEGRILLEVVSIDVPLPSILDDTDDYLPADIQADMVLDFLGHPDLSGDLARMCAARGIPVVASGKKHRIPGVYTPPT